MQRTTRDSRRVQILRITALTAVHGKMITDTQNRTITDIRQTLTKTITTPTRTLITTWTISAEAGTAASADTAAAEISATGITARRKAEKTPAARSK